MKKHNRERGQSGEKLAAAFLEDQGYSILECNFRCPLGEIDLVAREGRYLVFVEVKSRSNRRFGHPAEAVNFHKQRRLELLARYYLKKHGLEGKPCRFDVVSLVLEEPEASVELIRNAFSASGGW